MDRRMDRRMDGRLNGRTNGQMNGWRDGQMDGCIEKMENLISFFRRPQTRMKSRTGAIYPDIGGPCPICPYISASVHQYISPDIFTEPDSGL